MLNKYFIIFKYRKQCLKYGNTCEKCACFLWRKKCARLRNPGRKIANAKNAKGTIGIGLALADIDLNIQNKTIKILQNHRNKLVCILHKMRVRCILGQLQIQILHAMIEPQSSRTGIYENKIA